MLASPLHTRKFIYRFSSFKSRKICSGRELGACRSRFLFLATYVALRYIVRDEQTPLFPQAAEAIQMKRWRTVLFAMVPVLALLLLGELCSRLIIGNEPLRRRLLGYSIIDTIAFRGAFYQLEDLLVHDPPPPQTAISRQSPEQQQPPSRKATSSQKMVPAPSGARSRLCRMNMVTSGRPGRRVRLRRR